MGEADVEPVFRTKRQRLVRDVLTAVVTCAVLWFLYLGDPPAWRAAALSVGGGVAASAFVVAYAHGVLPWPDRRIWTRLVDVTAVVATVLLFNYAPTAIAWAGAGFAVGGLTARLTLYAIGAWRPGDPPRR